MVYTRTHCVDLASWYRHGGILSISFDIDLDPWYREHLMVKTETHGIVLIFLNNTQTRGKSVGCIRDFPYSLGKH